MLRYLLLALLSGGPRHGYELKGLFDEALGATWPINIAQIYAALSKLEEEGMVSLEVVMQENFPPRKVCSLTEAGEAELAAWLEVPADGPVRLRDEVFFKVLAHVLAGGGDSGALIRRQRQSYMQALAELNAELASPDLDAANSLLLEGAALRIEADLRWLDRCDERLRELVR